MSFSNSVRIGTSGWHYKHWFGPFYPLGFPKDRMLSFYSETFDTVEINNSFYRQPSDETLVLWRESVPDGFTFAYKASRYITHMKKLGDSESPLWNLVRKIEILGDRVGPVLFQLPPRFGFNPGKFKIFLSSLPGGFRYVFEFRDRSWITDEAFELLSQYGASFCIYSMGSFTTPMVVTSNLVYVRFHGPSDYEPASYSDEQLRFWADEIRAWKDAGKDVYCYFNNDINGYAVWNAKTLTAFVKDVVSAA